MIVAATLALLAMTDAAMAKQALEPAVSATAASERQQIEAATAAWNRAIVAKDRAALESIMADEFALTGDDARESVPRDVWLGNLPKMSFAKYDARVVDVRTYGKIAVAEVRGEWDVTMNGRRRSEPFRLADFWIFRDGRWQVFRRYRIS